MKIVLATRNQGKVRELVPILKPLGFELVTKMISISQVQKKQGRLLSKTR